MEDLEEYPFSFMNRPSSLKQLAATEVALTLWRYKSYSNLTFLSTGSEYKLLPITEISCEKMIAVPIPSRIRAQIDGKIDCIGRELADWVRFNSVLGLCDVDVDSEGAFSKCFEYVVLNAFCSIDFTASAINILNSGEFDDMKNYFIASTLYLEDQVRRFWPSVKRARIIHSTIDADSSMFYWNRLMKSKRNSMSDTLSIDNRIDAIFDFTPKSFCSWAPFEYFLKIWPNHEIESRTILFLERGGHPAMKRLLPTLNRLDAEKVFEKTADEILRMLVQNDDYLQNVHQLWAVVGHTFLTDESSFFNVLDDLWRLVINLFRNELDLVGERVNDVLIHVWSNAPDELKVVVSSNHIKAFIQSIQPSPSNRSYCYQQDMTFISELMTKSSYANKEELLRAHWRNLALTAKSSCLEKLVRSCFPDDAAVQLFKENIFSNESDGIFNEFVKNGFYSELKNYLNFFSNSNAEFCQQLSMEVLESNIKYILRHNDERFAEFDWFVNEVCLGVKNSIKEFKARMISSPHGLHHLLRMGRHHSNALNTISNRFVTSEQELLLVKCKLLEFCGTIYPIKGRESFPVSELEWQKLLEWCTPITEDAKGISAFKGSFNIDEIYLSRVMCYLDKSSCPSLVVRQSAVRFIDIFSKWYFTNAEVEEKFKLEKLKYYCKHVELFRNMLKSDVTEDRREMCELLTWFFDSDSNHVEEFKARLISPPEGVFQLFETYKLLSSHISEQKLLVVKRKLLEHCCAIYPIRGPEPFTVSKLQWQEVLEWCTPITDDAEEILAFKRSFNIELVYLSRVTCFLDTSRVRSPEVRQSALWFIDIFSKWYFTNAQVEKKFKKDTLLYYCKQVELFRDMVNATEHHRTDMSELLMWFFDNDNYKVVKFRAKIKWDYGLTTVW